MQLTTIFTLLTATATVASAWEFTGYRDQLYKGGVVVGRSGGILTNNLCVDIIINDNKMSSFKWYRGFDLSCSFTLFDGHGCKGRLLASSGPNWNVPAISAGNDNEASSLWVDCLKG